MQQYASKCLPINSHWERKGRCLVCNAFLFLQSIHSNFEHTSHTRLQIFCEYNRQFSYIILSILLLLWLYYLFMYSFIHSFEGGSKTKTKSFTKSPSSDVKLPWIQQPILSGEVQQVPVSAVYTGSQLMFICINIYQYKRMSEILYPALSVQLPCQKRK